MNITRKTLSILGAAIALGSGVLSVSLNTLAQPPLKTFTEPVPPVMATITAQETQQILQVQPQSAEDYYDQGIALQGSGDLAGAIRSFSEAIKLKPTADHYFARGLALSDQGDQQQAVADYTQAVRLDANFAAAYYNRGLAYMALQERQPAIADFSRAIQLDGSFVAAYYSRGMAYYDTGNEKLARQDYLKATELSPGIASAYYNTAPRPQTGGN